jgi:hypothetical protein
LIYCTRDLILKADAELSLSIPPRPCDDDDDADDDDDDVDDDDDDVDDGDDDDDELCSDLTGL